MNVSALDNLETTEGYLMKLHCKGLNHASVITFKLL